MFAEHGSKSKKVTQLDDLVVDDEIREEVRVNAPNVDPDKLLEQFKSYCSSKDVHCQDYRKAFMNSVRKAQELWEERHPEAKQADGKVDTAVDDLNTREDQIVDAQGDAHRRRPLTLKQQRFVDEYLIDLNATQAAIRAGYSKRTAEQQGFQLLKKTSVQAAVQEAIRKRSERTEITQDRVLQELAKIGFSNMKDFVEWGPDGVTLKESAEMDGDAALCVAEVYQTTTQHGGTVKFKLHDKVSALEKIAKHLGMFSDDPEKQRGRPRDFVPLEVRLAQYRREEVMAEAGNVVEFSQPD